MAAVGPHQALLAMVIRQALLREGERYLDTEAGKGYISMLGLNREYMRKLLARRNRGA